MWLIEDAPTKRCDCGSEDCDLQSQEDLMIVGWVEAMARDEDVEL